MSFISRPLGVGLPLTMCECDAFTALIEILMSILAHRDSKLMAPRATRDEFITRLAAVRAHGDTTFGSAEEARLRCDFHIL